MLFGSMSSHPREEELGSDDFQALAEWRYQIRKFLALSEEAARSVGIEPQHHQLLLAIKGLPEGMIPTISVIAKRMAVRHHTAVELVDRLVARGLVKRTPCSTDRRSVLVALTPRADWLLRRLSDQHRSQLRVAGPALMEAISTVLTRISDEDARAPSPEPPPELELES
jgi:DNA-binding MarR family transcriptional regulator